MTNCNFLFVTGQSIGQYCNKPAVHVNGLKRRCEDCLDKKWPEETYTCTRILTKGKNSGKTCGKNTKFSDAKCAVCRKRKSETSRPLETSDEDEFAPFENMDNENIQHLYCNRAPNAEKQVITSCSTSTPIFDEAVYDAGDEHVCHFYIRSDQKVAKFGLHMEENQRCWDFFKLINGNRLFPRKNSAFRFVFKYGASERKDAPQTCGLPSHDVPLEFYWLEQFFKKYNETCRDHGVEFFDYGSFIPLVKDVNWGCMYAPRAQQKGVCSFVPIEDPETTDKFDHWSGQDFMQLENEIANINTQRKNYRNDDDDNDVYTSKPRGTFRAN